MTQEVQKRKTYLVFISHSTKDRRIAKKLADQIEEKCRECLVKTFLDERDIQIGESIPESIRKHIQECNEFLVLLTQYSIDRPWVLIEIGAAWARKKRIIAIIKKVTPEEMPDIIAPYKAIDIKRFDEYLKQLFNRVKEVKK